MRFNGARGFINKSLILSLVFISTLFFYGAILIKKVFSKDRRQKRILLIHNGKIGDLICATPCFRAIKEKYPDSYLSVLAIPRVEEILQNNTRIDELIIVPLNFGLGFREASALYKKIKKENFDICVNLVPGTLNFILPFFAAIPERITSTNEELGIFYKILSRFFPHRLNFKRDTLSVRHYLDLLKFIGIRNDNLKKEVFVDGDSAKKAENFLRGHGVNSGDILVGMCLSAGNKIKEWGEENFARLADEIIGRHHCKIIVVGGPADGPMLEKFGNLVKNDVIITFRDFTLREVPALFKRFNYFISADTGPLYIANAVSVPVVDIVGPCNICDQPPIDEKCEVVYAKDLPCWPCSSVISPAGECKEGHRDCLRKTSVELVMKSFDKLITDYPGA